GDIGIRLPSGTDARIGNVAVQPYLIGIAFPLRGFLLGPALGPIRPVPSEWGARFGSGALHFALGFFGKGLPWSIPRLPFRSFFASVVRFRHQSSIFCKCTLFKGLGPFPLENCQREPYGCPRPYKIRFNTRSISIKRILNTPATIMNFNRLCGRT